MLCTSHRATRVSSSAASDVYNRHYLKLAGGCDRHCAYCAIPLITGKHISRPMEDILKEVEELVGEGVTEFQVIEQELTYYGRDLYGKTRIAELIDKMANITGVKWIRLHYAYPNHFPLELLDVMREHDNVCKYLDIALQHISDHMLSQMHRHVTKQETIDLIHTIRERVPGITIRTTLMVGFPGETEEQFQELIDFIKEMRFERAGVFAYSAEEGTPAFDLDDNVPDDVKQQRVETFMEVQQDISLELNANRVGNVEKVLIDRIEGEYYVGRTQYDSPEVDDEVLIKIDDNELEIGTFVNAKIVKADFFDCYAEIL